MILLAALRVLALLVFPQFRLLSLLSCPSRVFGAFAWTFSSGEVSAVALALIYLFLFFVSSLFSFQGRRHLGYVRVAFGQTVGSSQSFFL